MIPSFAGKVLTTMRLDFALKLWTDDDWEIDVAGDAIVTVPGATPVEVDTGVSSDELPDVLAPFVSRAIREVLVAREGHLGITFDDGSQISVLAAEDYEAWQVSGPDGERMVCMPGGELAIWGARAG